MVHFVMRFSHVLMRFSHVLMRNPIVIGELTGEAGCNFKGGEVLL